MFDKCTMIFKNDFLYADDSAIRIQFLKVRVENRKHEKLNTSESVKEKEYEG